MSAAGRGAVVTDFLRRAFTENLGLKVMALIGSLVLFVMRGTADDTGIVSARLVAPERDGYVLVSDVPEQVHITVSGSRALVNAVRSESLQDIRIPEDFGQRFFYIERGQFDLPPGVSVDGIEPTAIQLVWAEQTERRFRIDAVVEGDVAAGFVRTRAVVDPPTVNLRGAAPEVGDLSRVRTQPVDVAGLRAGEHELRVPLMPLPDHVSYVDTQSVVVTVTVVAEEGVRELEDLEVALVGGADMMLRPDHVNVTIRGPRQRIQDLHPRRIIPYVDVAGLDASLGAQPIEVRLRPLPEGVSVTTEPAEVLVFPPASEGR